MKILHTVEQYGLVGGVQTYLAALIGFLLDAGHESAIVYRLADSLGASVAKTSVHYVSRSDPDYLCVAPNEISTFGEIIQKESPDVIVVHDSALEPAMIKCAIGLAPTIRMMHGQDAYCPSGNKMLWRSQRICPYRMGLACIWNAYAEHCNSRRPQALYRSIQRTYQRRRWIQRVNHIIAVSSYIECTLVQNGFEPAQITVLPPYIYTPDDGSQTAPTESDLILFVGRVSRGKGVLHLLRALATVTVPFRLLVLGDGPERSHAEELTRDLGLTGRIEFLGWVPWGKQFEYIRRSALGVVPSIFVESCSVVGHEFLACNKPVIAFDVGGNPDWLIDGQTGFLVEPYDILQMAGRISWLLSNPRMAQAMGQAGREDVQRRCNKRDYLEKLEMVFAKAVQTWKKAKMQGDL